MAGKLLRGGVAALSVAAIVAGGSVVGAGTASAQSVTIDLTGVPEALTALSELTPAQWAAGSADLGLNAAALPLALALDAVGSLDYEWRSGCTLTCYYPPSPLEQLLGWAQGDAGS